MMLYAITRSCPSFIDDNDTENWKVDLKSLPLCVGFMDADDFAIAEVDKNNLQSDLLTAVKECQKKYGRRVELATELDPLVADVCHCFETIFNHGLKKHVPK